MPSERVSADEFLSRLITAPEWELTQGQFDSQILELHVMAGDEVNGYLTPDFIDMPELQVRVFFKRLNDFLNDPNMVKKRVKNYRDQKETLP
jgi:hypothetical protein